RRTEKQAHLRTRADRCHEHQLQVYTALHSLKLRIGRFGAGGKGIESSRVRHVDVQLCLVLMRRAGEADSNANAWRDHVPTAKVELRSSRVVVGNLRGPRLLEE